MSIFARNTQSSVSPVVVEGVSEGLTGQLSGRLGGFLARVLAGLVGLAGLFFRAGKAVYRGVLAWVLLAGRWPSVARDPGVLAWQVLPFRRSSTRVRARGLRPTEAPLPRFSPLGAAAARSVGRSA